ncbi:MAG TPA: ABC transporter substrate-binding protein [Ramlibacter sp.]|nr:ABC transporter substrate-binding protein [Ramlibacter sp.]
MAFPISRRTLLWLGCTTAAAAARGNTGIPQVLVAMGNSRSSAQFSAADLARHLDRLGWPGGRAVQMHDFYADGRPAQLAEKLAPFVGMPRLVVVTDSVQATHAALKALPQVPVVMVGGGDPVQAGLAVSLAQPGRSVTGVYNIGVDVAGKYVPLLREAMPKLARVGLLLDRRNPSAGGMRRAAMESAERLRVAGAVAEIQGAEELAPALDALARGGAQALVVFNSPALSAMSNEILAFAQRQRWPVVGSRAAWAHAGALISYGPSPEEFAQRAAILVDKILRGTPAGDLPFERPTRMQTVLNLRAARLLGLSVSNALLVQADLTIE